MLKYIKVTKDNIDLATKIQMQIFPKESAYQEFLNCINDNKEYNNYYIVYKYNNIIGITGLYTTDNIKVTNTLWMGWFGILKKYRKKGLGKKVLIDTIEMSKKYMSKYNIKYFRVFTSSMENPQVIPLYDKIMDFKEEYTNKRDYNYNNTCVIYTKVLGNYPNIPWNNKFLNINKMIENEKIGNEIFKT